MPSGPKKQRAAKKKKKKAKVSKKSVSSLAIRPRLGDGDDGPFNSPASKGQHSSPHPTVNVETWDDNSSGNKSLTIERTQKAVEEQQGKVEIERGPNSLSPHEKNLNSISSSSKKKSSDKKKAIVIEPAPVADVTQPIKSSPEKGTHKVDNLAVETSPIVDPVKSVDDVAAQVNNNTKLQEKNYLVVAKTPLEQKVINENVPNNNSSTSSNAAIESVSKEYGIQTLILLDEKDSVNSKEDLPASAFKCPFCGRNSADYANEPETSECSEKQPLLASAPRASEKTSWRSCCGVFELFSGSGR